MVDESYLSFAESVVLSLVSAVMETMLMKESLLCALVSVEIVNMITKPDPTSLPEATPSYPVQLH